MYSVYIAITETKSQCITSGPGLVHPLYTCVGAGKKKVGN